MGKTMTTPPGKLNITIYKGAAFAELFTIENQDDNGVITVTDLTGYTARSMAREEYDSVASFMNLNTENGGITLGGTAGTIVLFISAVNTGAIAATEGVWDLELIPPSGAANVIRILQGRVCVSEEATK
jgi:hypothetical protein